MTGSDDPTATGQRDRGPCVETDGHGRRREVDADGRRRAPDPPTAAQRVRSWCYGLLAPVAVAVLVVAGVRALG